METSEATVEWTMSELLRHPRVMRKLQQELEDAVCMDRMVEEEDLANLSYLGMVIKETMRLHPTIPLLLRQAREDCAVGGFHIREGTHVLVNLWAIGRDPSVWDDAEAFFPERFARCGSGGAGGDNDGYGRGFPAFGAGSQRCPSMHMGLTAVRIVVAQLVHCFDWEVPRGIPPVAMELCSKQSSVT